ncbi:MAG: hypothetical protein MK193_08705 [Lentisphaeria bacterium]|nr:hypothetical protein [Lentisphaeria bacterium]
MLSTDYTPQGLTKDENYFYITYYIPTGEFKGQTCLVKVNIQNSRYSIHSLMDKNERILGHAGGVAIWENRVYLANEGFLYIFLNSYDEKWTAIQKIPVATNASFCTIFENQLYIGDFYRKGFEPKLSGEYKNDCDDKIKKAKIAVYDLQDNFRLKKIIFCRKEVQGISFDQKHVILSVSYGRFNRSKLAYYDRTKLNTDKKFQMPNGDMVDLGVINCQNHLKTYTAPNMTEGIIAENGKLYVLTESGAKYYRNSTFKLDAIFSVEDKSLK